MGDVPDKLMFLINRYELEKKEMEDRLRELTFKLSALKEAKRLLEQEATVSNSKKVDVEPISEKYAGLTMRKAVMSVIESDPNKEWKGKEVVYLLKMGGFKTQSKDLMRDVYSVLSKLAKAEKILRIKTEVGVGYKHRAGLTQSPIPLSEE